MPEESTPQSARPLERRLATILCADVAGYSKMMAADEERTVRVFRGHREIFESLVNLHRGRIFNTAGDAVLAEFNSAVEAVRCATEIQAALRTRNEHLAPEEKMQFRIGINLGDVIIQGDDLLGDGVNVAARIQTATAPGGICISGSVHDQIQNKLSLDFRLLGEQIYKNIAKPVRTYTINEEGAAITTPARRTGRRVLAAISVAALAITGYWGYQEYDANRTEQRRIGAGLAAQLAAQKQATEQAQHAAEQARHEAQLQAQKLAAEQAQQATEKARREAQLQAQIVATEEGLRRAQDERNRVEQDRKLLEDERRAAEAAKRQAADESLRRAQEERAQLKKERLQLEADLQATANRRAASPATNAAPYDGNYSGRLCTRIPSKAPRCGPVALIVRNGIAEGSWVSPAKKSASARGTLAPDGSVQLNVATWAANGAPVEATLHGRIVDGAITASGQWSTGGSVAGDWKRMQVAAPYDGNYSGRLCTQIPSKAPRCWPVALVVRNGIAEGSWVSPAKKTASARGTLAPDGSVQLNLATWAANGAPVEATLNGRIVDGAITASGQWSTGGRIAGDWKRML